MSPRLILAIAFIANANNKIDPAMAIKSKNTDLPLDNNNPPLDENLEDITDNKIAIPVIKTVMPIIIREDLNKSSSLTFDII